MNATQPPAGSSTGVTVQLATAAFATGLFGKAFYLGKFCSFSSSHIPSSPGNIEAAVMPI
jgi:hypothetical protein